MKILYIYETITGRRKGIGPQTHNTCTHEALKKIGHDVVLLVDNLISSNERTSTHRNFYRRIIKKHLPDRIAIIPRDVYDIYRDRIIFRKKVKKFIEETRPEILYERFTFLHMAGLRAAKESNTPIIMEMHAPWEEIGAYFSIDSFPRYSKKIYKNALLEADAIITVSSSMKKYICDLRVCETKVHVIPNAVDQELFQTTKLNEIKEIKNKYSLYEKKVVGFIGSMAPYHGVDYLIEAARWVIKEQQDVVFLLIGSFREEKTQRAVLAKIHNYNLQEHFLFVGAVEYSKVPVWIDCIDVCVMAHSNWYGSPIKLFEYAAKGKPVVMPRLTPIEDIIEDERDGLLFEPGNSEDLARKIIRVLRESDMAKNMGLRLHKKVLTKHTWVHNANQIQTIAESLMKKRY